MAAKEWSAFSGALARTIFVILLGALAFVAAMNPYGNLPKLLFSRHVIMDSDQRFQYPSIIRAMQYDSAVIGNSSSRLLKPDQLAAAFGGRFVNLGINDSRAWEQTQVTKLLLRTVPVPRTLIFGLDWVWCAANADIDRMRKNEFPEWLYEDRRWVDWQYVLNMKAIEISLRRLGYQFGIGQPRFPPDGYEVFVPPDDTYDPPKASAKIWNGPPQDRTPVDPPEVIPAGEQAAWRFPALTWLADLAGSVPKETRLVFVFVPAHIAALPVSGTKEALRTETCKLRVVSIADAVGASVVDFRYRSDLTRRDENFWDPLHYRVPVATGIVAGLSKAVIGGQDDPRGTWRLLRSATAGQKSGG